MTDLAEIGFSIDSSQIKTAKQELAELGNSFNSATKSASIFEQAFARAAAQSAKDAAFLRDRIRANQDLINTNLGITNSYKSAEQSASAFGVVLNNIDRASKAFAANFNGVVGITGGRATSNGAGFGALADEIDRLGQKYNSIYASSKLYENTLNELNRAVMLGVISDKQREASIEALNSQMATGTGIFKNYTQQLGNNASRMGTIFQQTGYQVSDFIVQVQSGTNPLVAFSQQATQLVGALYALPPAFLATEVSVLGLGVTVSTLIAGFTIIVPLLAAVALAFMRSSDASKDATNSVDQQAQAYSNLIDKVQQLRLARQLEATGLQSQDELLVQNKINDLLSQRADIQDKLNQLNSVGGRAKVFADEKQAQSDLLKIELDKNTEALRAIGYEQQLITASKRRANERRDAYREEKKAKDERIISEQIAADKATFLKNVFHAMAGEAGAVSTSLDGWAGKIIAATEAAKNFKPMDYSGFTYGGAFAEGRGAGGAGMIPTNEGTVVGDKTATGTGGGGGVDKVQALLDSLQTQTEITDAWYEESQATLQSASDKELEILGGKEEAKLRLLNDYRQKQYEAQQAQSQLLYQSQAGMYSALGDLLSQFGTKSKGAAVAALAIQKGLSIAQIIANTAAAQMRALAELGPIAGSAMAAKIGLMGKLQVGLVAATGLMQAGSIMSGGASGGSGSGNGRNSVETSANNMQTASPQVVMIQGLKPTDVFTGEQLSTLFDSLYKENRNRGMVFQVAR